MYQPINKILLTISYRCNIKVEDCKSYFTGRACRKNMKLKVVKKAVLYIYIYICMYVYICRFVFYVDAALWAANNTSLF